MREHQQGRGEVLLRLAGPFVVERDGAPLPTAELGSRKARTLLRLLAVESPHLVPVATVVDVLWSGSPPARAIENVATLVSRLRATLGADVVRGGREGYRLGPAARLDLDLAAELVDEGRRRLAAAEPGLALHAALRAEALLGHGSVADDDAQAWAEPARVRLTSLTRQVRQLLAHAALTSGDLARAIDAAEALLAEDGYDEDACRVLMRAHVGRGESARALAAFEELRERLADELGADPSAPTRELHQLTLRDELRPALGRASPTRSRGSSGSALVGRSAELADLGGRWEDAVAGRPSLLLLVGEAGIGKTCLMDELVRLAGVTGGVVLAARCHETERSLFLQPLVEAIGGACRSLPPELVQRAAGSAAPTLAGLVPDVAAVLGEPTPTRRMTLASERRRAFEAVTGFVRRLAEQAPVLLALDDLHLAGRATFELLHYVAAHCQSSRLLVAITVRPDEGREGLDLLADVAATLSVPALPAAAVAELAAAAGQADLTEVIQQRTQGHAFFVVETLRGLAAGDAGVPLTLQAAVLARVRRLGPAGQELLGAGAVLGATFSPVTASQVLEQPLPSVLAAAERALAAGLLVPTGSQYAFANDLVREVLYSSTPEPTRVAQHLRAADLLTDLPEAVATHASAAGDWPRAARAWLLAAEQALQRFAVDDAEGLVTGCLDAADRAGDLDVRGRALLLRGRARAAQAKYADALDDLEGVAVAARAIGDQRLEMAALRALGGEAPAALGRPLKEAVDHLDHGLRIATTLGDRAMEADLLGWLAILASNGLRFAEAVGYGTRAVAAARASGSAEALAAGLDGRKTSLAYLGQLDELMPVLQELEPLLRRLDDPLRLHWTLFESGFPAVAAR